MYGASKTSLFYILFDIFINIDSTSYQKSEQYFFDETSIDEKSQVKGRKWPLVEYLKLKLLNLLFRHFQFQLYHRGVLVKFDSTFFIFGPFVKKVLFRFLIALVLTDFTPYIASILNACRLLWVCKVWPNLLIVWPWVDLIRINNKSWGP